MTKGHDEIACEQHEYLVKRKRTIKEILTRLKKTVSYLHQKLRRRAKTTNWRTMSKAIAKKTNSKRNEKQYQKKTLSREI